MGCGSSPGGAYMGGGHTCTPSWEVPSGHLAVHTGGRTPKHDGSDDRTVGVGNHDWERNEKGQRTEPIKRPTGDGVHRRAAGDAAARAAHHRPDDRPRPPSASGGPARGFAQSTSGARGRAVRGRPTWIPASTLDSITSANPTGILSTFVAGAVHSHAICPPALCPPS